MDANPPSRRPKRAPAERIAAIFDLDRTLVGDSSGLLVVEALVDAGLVSDRERVVADLTRRVYRVVGETWIGMQLTRRGLSRFTGWSAADLRQAAERSVDRMDTAVYQEARDLIERHRSRGHVVCIATSTGRDIVEPLAERLGIDNLIATDYERDDQGILTGNLIGQWLWGPDKARAVEEFAAANAIDLSQSYAYTDSFYDRHMLERVGYPRAVNPDPLLRALALARGWPVLEFRNADSGPRTGLEPYDVLRPLAHPLIAPVNVQTEGAEHIPTDGPCIVAANHRSYLDPVALSIVAARRGRKLRYLGKKELFDVPVAGDLMRALGQIRVDRGSGSDEPLRLALDALERGEAIGIFPQGTVPKGEQFYEPKLKGKTGVVRLALALGLPVIPVALWGTERIWPRSSRVPHPVEVALRRPVHARVGDPIELSATRTDRRTLDRLTQRVLDTISAMLPADVRENSESAT